jgi:glycerate 2-kinase
MIGSGNSEFTLDELAAMKRRSADQLTRDAIRIWQAGVSAVDSSRLVREHLRVEGPLLIVGDEEIDLRRVRRIVVVGAGKAGAGMAAGVEAALGEELAQAKHLTGWVNVPADCLRPLQRIKLHAARPAGRNEPTEEGVLGTSRILELVAAAGPDDLVLCLISGGGSALLPAPLDGITLADKQAITKLLSSAGANIAELNTVRKALSRVKGNGLARACRAGRLATLIISDVLGDPLDVIASGPTVPNTTNAADALAVLEKFGARQASIGPHLFSRLERLRQEETTGRTGAPTCRVTNTVIGNNATAVDAAGLEAERLGYSHAMHAATTLEGSAESVGRHLAEMAVRMRVRPGPDCLITGGEPTVALAPEERRGRGGRNQQLVLAALQALSRIGITAGVTLLSGGTDGEDGPTDAAGAILDERLLQLGRTLQSPIASALERNDAYTFFNEQNMLIRTGPTHTNVCDLRVVTIDRIETERRG